MDFLRFRNISPDTLGQLLLKRCYYSYSNNAIGYIENGKILSLTYRDYFENIQALTLGLKSLGFESQNALGILGSTCKEWHLLDMAGLLSQGIVVPIYHTYTPKDIEYIINHSQCTILCLEDEKQLKKIVEIQEQLPNLKYIITFKEIPYRYRRKIETKIKVLSFEQLKIIGLKNSIDMQDKLVESVLSQSPKNIASIIYTSGTTGKPKGAVITQEAFCAMLRNVDQTVNGRFTENDRILTWLPLSHVYGRCDSLLLLVFGWEMIFAEDMDKLAQNFTLVKPTICLAVPRIFEKIRAKIIAKMEKGVLPKKAIFDWASRVSSNYHNKVHNNIRPTSNEILQHRMANRMVWNHIYKGLGGNIRYIISGGAPLSPELMLFFRNANLTILEGYGLTE
ncbi:MAG: AMP-binding protein, partial [Bacteriovoracia bacterium]